VDVKNPEQQRNEEQNICTLSAIARVTGGDVTVNAKTKRV